MEHPDNKRPSHESQHSDFMLLYSPVIQLQSFTPAAASTQQNPRPLVNFASDTNREEVSSSRKGPGWADSLLMGNDKSDGPANLPTEASSICNPPPHQPTNNVILPNWPIAVSKPGGRSAATNFATNFANSTWANNFLEEDVQVPESSTGCVFGGVIYEPAMKRFKKRGLLEQCPLTGSLSVTQTNDQRLQNLSQKDLSLIALVQNACCQLIMPMNCKRRILSGLAIGRSVITCSHYEASSSIDDLDIMANFGNDSGTSIRRLRLLKAYPHLDIAIMHLKDDEPDFEHFLSDSHLPAFGKVPPADVLLFNCRVVSSSNSIFCQEARDYIQNWVERSSEMVDALNVYSSVDEAYANIMKHQSKSIGVSDFHLLSPADGSNAFAMNSPGLYGISGCPCFAINNDEVIIWALFTGSTRVEQEVGPGVMETREYCLARLITDDVVDEIKVAQIE